METKRINLTGNRSLINNKAHIDENWEKFSKNNSPYLRDALVPHYLKEESKNVASNIVFDKEGNKYYVDNDKFFVNDEAVTDVSSTGFVKTDLEENTETGSLVPVSLSFICFFVPKNKALVLKPENG